MISVSSEQKKAAQALPVKDESKAGLPAAAPVLSGQPLVLVNTTTQGDQVLRSLGALDEGGYGVAWQSGAEGIFIQRFDSAGSKIGGEVKLQQDNDVSRPSSAISLGVLRDGSVVGTYIVVMDIGLPDVYGRQFYKESLNFKRFDSTGAQVQPVTEVISHFRFTLPQPSQLTDIKTIALADGGFVMGWSDSRPTVGGMFETSSSLRRFDRAGQAMGSALTISVNLPSLYIESYSLKPDAFGGYMVYVSQRLRDYSPFQSPTYFDIANVPHPIALPSGTNGALLLPLEAGRFVLFGQGSSGAYRQFLDGLGNPIGAQTPVSALPTAAHELADDSYVTFTAVNAGVLAQRFDSEGVALGESALINTQGAGFTAVALSDRGFVASWTGTGALSGQDVFAQRFTIFDDTALPDAKAKRKACKQSAISQGLKGKARKQFMDACLTC